MARLIEEGKAKLNVYNGKISKKLEVFYNPVMKHNRDISVLLLKALDRKKMKIGLPLAGTGIRGIRFLKEVGNVVEEIFFNDSSEKAVKDIKKNIKLNKITKKAEVFCEEADMFLLKSSGFQYIDIDPFGSPNPFLDSAVKRISREGILAVTATDTAPLAGTFEKTCMRKYWAKPLLNEEKHEIGLRILIRKVQLHGMNYDKALIPIFSYFKDHYFRVFFICEKGKKKCDEIVKKHGMYNGAGPLWMGKLWDEKVVGKVFKIAKNDSDKELVKFLKIIKDESEINAVGFYDLHGLCKRDKIKKIPRKEELILRLKKKGFKASETHFTGYGVRSDISLKELIKIMKK